MQTNTQTQITPERTLQFVFGYAPTLVLEAAVQHGLFNTLSDMPKTLDQVSRETNTSRRGLRAVLNALVGLGFLAREAGGTYALTPESAAFLVSGRPGYLGGMFQHVSKQLLPKWMHLSEIVCSGQPADTVNAKESGEAFFPSLVEDLFAVNYPATQALGNALRISEAEQAVEVLDIGAGSGVWGIGLAQKSPHVRVTAVDWPEVLNVTRGVAARFGMEDRFDYLGDDFLKADFRTGYRIAVLGHILHSLGKEECRLLLQKTGKALAPGGTVAISEWLVNEERTQPVGGLLFAVNMLINTEQGDTYSFAEIEDWLREAGFENARTVDIPGPTSIILADKPTK